MGTMADNAYGQPEDTGMAKDPASKTGYMDEARVNKGSMLQTSAAISSSGTAKPCALPQRF